MTNKMGSINRYRKEALHIQLPPDSSIDRLRTKVKAKKKAANTPSQIDRKTFTLFFKYRYYHILITFYDSFQGLLRS
ncbi:hypothetical protein [Paenibacillus sp. RC82]|uniref:hypothetical protein n=1 Tax=Paenibacillus sp. RC82 TaxID=3156251 RepID=UPI00384D9282